MRFDILTDTFQTSIKGKLYSHICYKGGGGGGSTNTTVQKADPWGGQQPYLADVYTNAQTAANTPMTYYEGNTVAGYTPEQQAAHNMATQRALLGSVGLKDAQNQAAATARGDYLSPDSNPWLNQVAQRQAGMVGGQFDNSAVSAGRYGSGAWSLGKEGALNDAMTSLYGGAYEGERARQLQASSMIPQLGQADYYDIGQLAAVGEDKQAYEQALIQDAMNRHQFEQMEPWNRLNLYSNLVQGHQGGTTTMTAPYYKPSSASQLLGGAAAAGSLGMSMASLLGSGGDAADAASALA